MGFTLGLHDVHYRNNSYYTENYVADKEAYGSAWESQRITGTGYDAKLGVIFRPVADSPFRIGAYVNSPVLYDLSLSCFSSLLIVLSSSSFFCSYVVRSIGKELILRMRSL